MRSLLVLSGEGQEASHLINQKLDHIVKLRYSEYTLIRIPTRTKQYKVRNNDSK